MWQNDASCLVRICLSNEHPAQYTDHPFRLTSMFCSDKHDKAVPLPSLRTLAKRCCRLRPRLCLSSAQNISLSKIIDQSQCTPETNAYQRPGCHLSQTWLIVAHAEADTPADTPADTLEESIIRGVAVVAWCNV